VQCTYVVLIAEEVIGELNIVAWTDESTLTVFVSVEAGICVVSILFRSHQTDKLYIIDVSNSLSDPTCSTDIGKHVFEFTDDARYFLLFPEQLIYGMYYTIQNMPAHFSSELGLLRLTPNMKIGIVQ